MKCVKVLLVISVVVAMFESCKQKTVDRRETPKENIAAKKMLQGIWVNEDAGDVAFRVKGDTIFYPDSTSQPVCFQIYGDTLVLHGGVDDVKYHIEKQTEHLFAFKNQNDELVRLSLSENKNDIWFFENQHPAQALNQNQLIKRDSAFVRNNERYHCYVQINPTTYKVIKTSYNDEGVEVDNIYHDNIIHMSVFNGARKIYSSNFYKHNFAEFVPKEYFSQSILSDMTFERADNEGFHFLTTIGIPDSPSVYLVEVVVDYGGKMMMKVNNK